MLLDIRHVTRYHYERPIRESLMELRMQPQKSIRQRLISFDLELDPRAQLFSYIDPFGNAVHHFDVPQPHDELTIVARACVETQDPPELPEHLDLFESGIARRLRVAVRRRPDRLLELRFRPAPGTVAAPGGG